MIELIRKRNGSLQGDFNRHMRRRILALKEVIRIMMEKTVAVRDLQLRRKKEEVLG